MSDAQVRSVRECVRLREGSLESTAVQWKRQAGDNAAQLDAEHSSKIKTTIGLVIGGIAAGVAAFFGGELYERYRKK